MRTSAIKKNHKIYIFKHQQTSSGGGGGADLEDNKTVTITENGTVEITPSAGKDGMKKVTAIVNTSVHFYRWVDEYGEEIMYTVKERPVVGDKVYYNDTILSPIIEVDDSGEAYKIREKKAFDSWHYRDPSGDLEF